MVSPLKLKELHLPRTGASQITIRSITSIAISSPSIWCRNQSVCWTECCLKSVHPKSCIDLILSYTKRRTSPSTHKDTDIVTGLFKSSSALWRIHHPSSPTSEHRYSDQALWQTAELNFLSSIYMPLALCKLYTANMVLHSIANSLLTFPRIPMTLTPLK